ncbi:TetR/AcrR family transcriptional regulator [Allostreptomyces psammosilenae]|uniref:AcrR family transcriptional regulator n=1 Tax=Allostreptomyces psammosilenae TaxID=1892865 RepID=A0A852ZZ22_9ACTN|nr:TetR/AcrR family transcriptional regulator [Allostreptomyces psammosilenae]NYI03522.1 AcrR family transcriptional regulator [Allostreptomyces psammosilenae]
MSGAGTRSGAAAAGARGRIDKRWAILDAAFAVFAREGYAQAGVDAIAAEAGVAKATVYNHFGDKETLLRQAVTAHAERALAQNLAAVERLTDRGGELGAMLQDVGYHLLQCYCDERSWALRRLLAAELHQFPDLLDIVQGQVADRVTEALADRLARLALAGRLNTTDALLAAEQFSGLLVGPVEKRSRLGTRQLPDAELRDVVGAAVCTFLRAFAPDGAHARQAGQARQA